MMIPEHETFYAKISVPTHYPWQLGEFIAVLVDVSSGHISSVDAPFQELAAGLYGVPLQLAAGNYVIRIANPALYAGFKELGVMVGVASLEVHHIHETPSTDVDGVHYGTIAAPSIEGSESDRHYRAITTLS